MTPTPPPADRDLFTAALRLTHHAARTAATAFLDAAWAGSRKPDGTEVTDTDRAVEEHLRRELARLTPDDTIHGEETGTTPGTSGRRWTIDPINGTGYFTTIAAARGHGCWILEGPEPDLATARPARVTTRTRLTGARTQAHNIAGWPEALLTTLHHRVHLTHSTGITAALVTGHADAGIIAGPPMGPEDLAPMAVIVPEAGGRITDLDGRPVLAGDTSVLATNGHLHDAYLTLLQGLPPAERCPAPRRPPSRTRRLNQEAEEHRNEHRR
ncbi:inositol monophosphatase family protein [Uniformispora flossi]|uniref:inositol monophosphatase family protein n=1 Tax=Uniformispora flossi TaxID=3390723 RepID=UPI003C2CF46A